LVLTFKLCNSKLSKRLAFLGGLTLLVDLIFTLIRSRICPRTSS